jgi:hypothetical protein
MKALPTPDNRKPLSDGNEAWSLEAIRTQAEVEVAEENFREAVAQAKAVIRARIARPWWHRLVPFTVTFAWRL